MDRLLVLLALSGLLVMAETSSLYARVSYSKNQVYLDYSSFTDRLVTINPASGAVSEVMQLDSFKMKTRTPYYGMSAVDPKGVMYYAATTEFPKTLSQANITAKQTLYPVYNELEEILAYSYDTIQNRLLVAMGWVTMKNSLSAQLLAWSNKPKSYPTTYAQLDNDGSFVATTGVVDSKNQLYYWIAMPKPQTLLLKWVSVASPNGQVNSVQLKCNNQLTPLSMSFDSARQKLLFYGGLYNSNAQAYTLYINIVDSSGNCNTIQTGLEYAQYVSTFGYDEVNQVLYASVDSMLYTLNARTGAVINTVTVANNLVPYNLHVL